MKILFFIESLHAGGKERRIVELIKGLSRYRDIECELVLTKGDIHYQEIHSTKIIIHIIERKYFKKDPRLFFHFYKICRNYRPDVIHVWGNLVAYYAIPAKLILNIPMINCQITDAPQKVNTGVLSHKITFPFSDLIVANSRAGIIAYNPPRNKSKVIYNGFDFTRIDKIENPHVIRKRFDIKTKKVVGMIASFSDKKDYKTYIESAQIVLNYISDVTFLCVGNGNNRYYNNMVKDKYKNEIKFLKNQKNVENIMNICDIGVLSTYTEGISNTIMEFMALGKAVIATDGGGTKELVIDGRTGFLIEPKEPILLSKKILLLLTNEKFLNEFGRTGKKMIKELFAIEDMVTNFYQLYKKVCKSRCKKITKKFNLN